MTKEALISLTAQKSGIPLNESKELAEAVFQVLEGYLEPRGSITVPELGSFDLRIRKGGRLLNIGRLILGRPQKYSIFFHPSQQYVQKLYEKLSDA